MKCEECGKEFKTKRGLHSHIGIKHMPIHEYMVFTVLSKFAKEDDDILVEGPSVEPLLLTPDSEELIAFSARTCYDSHNKKSKESDAKLIKKLIELGHESPLEHAVLSVRIFNVSRAFTHQWVRHRLCSFSQKSQRYVNEEQFTAVIPPSINSDFICKLLYRGFLRLTRLVYTIFRKRQIPKEDARFILTNGCTSEIITTANFREWRHIIKVRTAKKAQWEIKLVANKIKGILREAAPNVFGDI